MLFPSLILLASTVFTATNALVLSTTDTVINTTAAPTILQRDATTTALSASTSPVYFLTTNYVTIAGVTNAHVTVPAKTISFAVPTCIQTLTPDKNGYLLPGTCNALYDYYPSSALALTFATIFGVLTLAHLTQAVFYKKVFICLCSIEELYQKLTYCAGIQFLHSCSLHLGSYSLHSPGFINP